MFSNVKSLDKINFLQKRAPCFLYSDYGSSYEIIFLKAGKITMDVSRMKTSCFETCKTINNINLQFINEIFNLNKDGPRKILAAS